MDFLIVSDTHGRYERLAELLERTHADTVLFLGDGLRDLAVVPDDFTLRAVRGNCDFFAPEDTPDERLEVFGATRILMMHGHRYHVKSGLGAALAAAADSEADVLLYGHTHRAEERYLSEDGLLVVNPGSIGRPQSGDPSYAILDILPSGDVAVSHGEAASFFGKRE